MKNTNEQLKAAEASIDSIYREAVSVYVKENYKNKFSENTPIIIDIAENLIFVRNDKDESPLILSHKILPVIMA